MTQRRRRRPASAGGRFYDTAAWQKTRKAILQRDGNACRLCGTTQKLSVQHKVPERMAPHLALEPANLVTLCLRCHGKQDGGRRYRRIL